MSSRPRKRSAPNAYGLISAGAMRSAYNKKASAIVVKKLAKRVRALESDTEVKYFDTALSFTVDATGEIPATGGQLCLIATGDDVVNREGWKVAAKALQIRVKATFDPGASATAASTVVYIYVVLDC